MKPELLSPFLDAEMPATRPPQDRPGRRMDLASPFAQALGETGSGPMEEALVSTACTPSGSGIIGDDDRRKVADSLEAPCRWICQLWIRRKDSDGNVTVTGATGVLISPRHVLTVAHALLEAKKDDHGRWITYEATDVRATPARSGDHRPLDTYPATLPPMIAPKYDPKGTRVDRDFAILTLDTAVGDKELAAIGGAKLGYWGSAGGKGSLQPVPAAQLQGKTAITVGYPGDHGGDTGYLSTGRLSGVYESRPIMDISADACQGQSGSPVWINVDGKHCLVGMMVMVTPTSNLAIRVSADVCRQLCAWMKGQSDICRRPAAQQTGKAADEALFVTSELESPFLDSELFFAPGDNGRPKTTPDLESPFLQRLSPSAAEESGTAVEAELPTELADTGSGEIEDHRLFEGLAPATSDSTLRSRIDDYLDLANIEYTTDLRAKVRVPPQFRYATAGGAEAAKTAVGKILGTKLAQAIHNAAYGRATLKEMAAINQGLIDAGEMQAIRADNPGMTDAQLIRRMQHDFRMGIDCAGYVQLAFIHAFMNSDNDPPKVRANLGLDGRRGNERLEDLPSSHFTKVKFVDGKTGDLFVFKPRAGDRDRSIHTVIVVDHTVNGSEHAFLVDASWGTDLYGEDAGGVARRTLMHDTSTGTWWDIHPIDGTKANENAIGPYAGHVIGGMYRAKQAAPPKKPATTPELESGDPNPDLFDPAELEWTGSSQGELEASFGDGPRTDRMTWQGPELESEANGRAPAGESEDESWAPAFPSDGEAYAADHETTEGEVVLLEGESEQEEQAPKQTPVTARILWPALGFPAVISPRDPPAEKQMTDGDATRCITVLLLSDRKVLSKEEAARYLRYVPWTYRGRRHIPPGQGGSFTEEQLAVRNDEQGPRLLLSESSKSKPALIAFGGDGSGVNTITVALAHRVRDFYRKEKLQYLHEIRISEAMSGKLKDGQYHLFWNNDIQNEKVPSAELQLLLDRFATPRRMELKELWETNSQDLLREYELEYGVLREPYMSKLQMRETRTEILHPLFVNRRAGKALAVGHITDTHVAVRADVYEKNLARAKAPISYNNWNTSFVRVYNDAKRDSDVILLTGDLIDYGRGHWGPNASDRLGEDGAYHVDRNWFLFYYLLASGEAYQRPVYTILGNHDWRLNPYPPFALAGAPGPETLINDYAKYTPDEREQYIRTAHGPGYEKKFSYYAEAKSTLELLTEKTGDALKAALRMFIQRQTLDEPHTPTETTVESVAWYLFSINPFLDYSFSLPSGHQVLMLDWAENENVLFPIVVDGKQYPYMLWQAKEAAGVAPKARDCLTATQQRLVEAFAGARGTAKIIGIHAPPLSPYPDWYAADLARGQKVYEANDKHRRGPSNYAIKRPDGSVEKLNGFPLFAVAPKNAPAGIAADYNSFEHARDWFIKRIAPAGVGVRAVLSGHIHRDGLFVAQAGGKDKGSLLAGQLLLEAVGRVESQPARPLVVNQPMNGRQGPLYINTTSAGPRGNSFPVKGRHDNVDPGYARLELAADGAINKIEFRASPLTGAASKSPGAQQPELAGSFA
ncbi:MAG: trypsin-like peptidase domain-containing protein [Gemmatimonadota bacterium]